ncbi:Leucine Rich repeats (2 copies) [Anatilimnocola aggregata]|uniref:Leucine Rich repeats (2 copies) n=1 Tax=Anatilimnocola aggregata TaxID=2528021 RepID=A0A517Y9I3_9BACT|nr:hypothetical protein [Anatilimnocola aggregata]QDU26889.1 Leucine Rich repeats (2 copies) [Anatilimnocola aggregata]
MLKYSLALAFAISSVQPLMSSLRAEEPTAQKQRPAATKVQFGVNSAAITSPEMREAVNRFHECGVIEGRRGSLTFFRWTTAEPQRLAHLGLWGPKAGNDSLLLAATTLPDLENVSIYETNINDDGLQGLVKLTKLKSLAITPIVRYEKAGFGPPQWSYPFMEQRSERPRVTGKSLEQLAQIKTIESLNLLDAQLSSNDLKALTAWPKLSNLALPNVIDAETVKHLQACPRLNSLTLGYREIAAAELERLSAWKSLRKLHVIHAKLSEEAIAALSKLATVEELHLEDCGLTDDRLASFQPAAKLTYLGLERNEINGPGLSHLDRLKLKELGLEFNNISDKTLSHLLHLTTLETLGLSYCCEVTDAGIQSGKLQEMKQLKELRLRGMKLVTDASLSDLVKFNHLQHINVRETKISPEGVAKMKVAMPKTDVFK